VYKNFAGILGVWQEIFEQYNGKYASRFRAKLESGLYAGLPYITPP
jgi:hypothetical protein